MSNEESRPAILLGSGGHARVLIEHLQSQGELILGLVDPHREKSEKVYGLTVLGDDNTITTYPPDEIYLINGIGQTENSTTRYDVAKKFRNLHFIFKTIIHPAAQISNDVLLAEGVQIMAGAVVQPGTAIGRDTIINTGALIDHDCIIGSFCHICPGAILTGKVRVGDRSMICSGATIIPNKVIGDDVVISAGAVIHEDISSNIRYFQPAPGKKILHQSLVDVEDNNK